LKFYKYQLININSLSALESSKLWAAIPETFNDPFEFRLNKTNTAKGFEKLRIDKPQLSHLNDEEIVVSICDQFESEIRKMGVVCYSKDSENILMWAHYANDHYGMCLEFTLDNDKTFSDAAIYEVDYLEDYPEIDVENIWHKDGLAKILYTKSKVWEKEDELRIILVDGNSLVDYPKYSKLTGIIFGYRTPINQIDLIKNILKDKNINFKKMKLADSKFKIESSSI
jgi:hypothetical protein